MIGIFDSGIGGLTVVKELLRVAPDVSFIYLGDTARTPYGNKSKEVIERYALEDAAFLVQNGATSLVVACNTASALALDALRAAHPGLPLFDVVTPAVENAASVAKKKIGVIGTRATIGSRVYQERLRDARPDVSVIAQACPLFVPLVEEGWTDAPETKRIMKHYLYSMRASQLDALILGCTHYPLLAPLIARFVGMRVRLIDSATSVVSRILQNVHVTAGGPQRYVLTDVSLHSVDIARAWLGRDIACEAVMF